MVRQRLVRGRWDNNRRRGTHFHNFEEGSDADQ